MARLTAVSSTIFFLSAAAAINEAMPSWLMRRGMPWVYSAMRCKASSAKSASCL